MRKNINNKDTQELSAKQQAMRDINAFMDAVEKETGVVSVSRDNLRADVAPPDAPEKNMKNTDGIVDVITFCEHPYFVNLRLTPWQKLILKLFYCGTEGNTHLKIENERSDTCKGCVWESNCRAAEEKTCDDIKAKKIIPYNYMHIENSPCVQCERFSNELRKIRYDYVLYSSLTDAIKAQMQLLADRPIRDNFTTEQDLFENDLNDSCKEQIRGKIGLPFQELILVLGRRSGKSFMVSVIALYEVYRLLMMGSPQKRYSLLDFDAITILNVASSEDTAKSAIFDKIKNLAETSPYFSKYLGKPPTSLKIFFLTPADIEESDRRVKSGMAPLEGTVIIQSGHSNSATLVGRTVFTVIIDEMAAMSSTSSDSEGVDEALYSMLKPSLATFGMQGKMICISNPLGPQGKFYKLYQTSFVDKTTLMIQLPTWCSNPTVTKEFLRSEELKDPGAYNMHYGAEFGVTGASPFLPSWAIDAAFANGYNKRRVETGLTNIHYFAHLDPAFSSDNYTLVVVHLEIVPGMVTLEGKEMKEVVVDHMHIWRPRSGFPVDSNVVDSYIVALSSKFRFAQISYDHWGSQASISKLQTYGLNVIQRQFSRTYQNLIFSEMLDLFTMERMNIYDVNTLYEENGEIMMLEEASECRKQLLTLQKRWRSNGTYKVEALKGNFDDFPDCLAAASFEALKFKEYQRLARTKSVYTGTRFL